MTYISQQRSLFKLFIMEDDVRLLEELVWQVPRKLPGTDVKTAGTIKEALSLLGSHFKPDLAVVDARVPESPGMHEATNPSVPDRIHELRVPSVCISGYVDSDDVVAYLDRQKLTSPPRAVIKKTLDRQWFLKLFGEIRSYFTKLASDNIRKSIYRIFNGSGDDGHMQSGTGVILSLQQDIWDYWFYLDEPTRNQVRQWFCIEVDEQDRITRLEL